MATIKANVRVIIEPSEIVQRHGLNDHGRCQQKMDSEIIRLCEPYVPKDLGTLIGSGVQNTQIGSGKIIWDTPYAKRWYYEPAKFQGAPTRGNHWFERMWNEGGRDQIVQTLAAEAGGHAG